MGHVVFIIERIQLHKLPIRVLWLLRCIGRHFVVFQVVDPKRRSADASPGVMRSFPSLSTQEGFTALSSRMFLFHEISEICTDQIIIRSDVELPQQKVGGPIRILNV